MARKVSVNITKKDYEYIDGATGESLTPQQFAARHRKGARAFLGGNGVAVQKEGGEEEAR